VAHLPIFDADTPIFGDALDEAGFALLIDLHILAVEPTIGSHRKR
jgi:hypothetical protein